LVQPSTATLGPFPGAAEWRESIYRDRQSKTARSRPWPASTACRPGSSAWRPRFARSARPPTRRVPSEIDASFIVTPRAAPKPAGGTTFKTTNRGGPLSLLCPQLEVSAGRIRPCAEGEKMRSNQPLPDPPRRVRRLSSPASRARSADSRRTLQCGAAGAATRQTLAGAQRVTDSPRRGHSVWPRIAENGRVLRESYGVLARAIKHEPVDHAGGRMASR